LCHAGETVSHAQQCARYTTCSASKGLVVLLNAVLAGSLAGALKLNARQSGGKQSQQRGTTKPADR